MNTEFFTKIIPSYWSLAKTRCALYAFVVAASTFKSGISGYNSFSDMTKFQILDLILDIIIAVGMVWVAFFDNAIGGFNNKSTFSSQQTNQQILNK